jgi:hypothetical protein
MEDARLVATPRNPLRRNEVEVRDVPVVAVAAFEGARGENDHVLSHAVGPHDDPLLLVVERRSVTAAAHAGVRRPELPYSAEVLHLTERLTRVTLPSVHATFPRIQPLPTGEWIVVDSLYVRGGTPNGRVYGPGGDVVGEWVLGDGIEDVQATADGRIWVSFFDEGVFSNGGFGAAGLVRFSPDGEKEWEYTPPTEVGPIHDCYALNVAEDATWACYYPGFPLIRIDSDGGVESWTTPTGGATAFAIGDGRAIFHGDYHDQARDALLEFDHDKLVLRCLLRLIAPSGEPVTSKKTIGRGSILHTFDESHYYQLDLRRLEIDL